MGNTIDCVGVSDNKDRGCHFGGEDSSPAYTNSVEYWQISSLGNALDFGDLTRTVSGGAAVMANNIKGCVAGTSPSTDTIDSIVFETRGNAIDFGNLTVGRASAAGVANKVRGVYAGGRAAPVQKNEIDFITNRIVFISIAEPIEECKLNTVAVGNLNLFLEGEGLKTIGALSNASYAEENGYHYIGCENATNNTVIIIQSGDESKIVEEAENCYVISFKDCEITQATEKFSLSVLEQHMAQYAIVQLKNKLE